uniref:RxLR effector candidate protein n=1 Tax=Hyaloperonospora arabidopsidis (strain Emoy2) TaxID=559515 RepID=A0A090BGY9_HYAAE|nr:RxLR effector candidate protein [Hyaloperonospora arabidopsidis Emoy2]
MRLVVALAILCNFANRMRDVWSRTCGDVHQSADQLVIRKLRTNTSSSGIFARFRFMRSAIPFCSGLYGTVNSCFMYFTLQNLSIAAFRYSPPLSLRSTLIFFPVNVLISW